MSLAFPRRVARFSGLVDPFVLSQQVLRRALVTVGVRSKVAQVRGQAVHYYELEGTGRGPPALLVHGLAGSANGFYRLFHGMAKRFSRVIAPDLPGHGFSPVPAEGPLSVLEQFSVLLEFCQRVVREPSYVVGNSLGGAMAINLGHQYPDLARALALVAPGGARVSPERFQELARSMHVKTTAHARALTRRLFHRPPVLALVFAGWLRPMYENPCVPVMFKELAAKSYIEPEVLEALKMPVLLLWGQSEKHLPFEGIDYFRQHMPKHARIEVVKHFGHVPQVERPGELLKRLIGFADAEGI